MLQRSGGDGCCREVLERKCCRIMPVAHTHVFYLHSGSWALYHVFCILTKTVSHKKHRFQL